MTDDDTTGLDVPRRKLLGAIGVVGASSAGAGLGTSAYFSDAESFTGNSLQAGELNLKLGGEVAATNSNAIVVDIEGTTSPVDGSSSTAFFGLSDVKPGDLAIVCLEIELEGNPAYLKIGGNVESHENSVNEAEAGSDGEDDSFGSTSGIGELAENTYIQAFGPIEQPSDGFESIDTENYSSSLASFNASGGNSTFAGGDEVTVASAFSTGNNEYVPLDASTSDPQCFDPNIYRIYFALNVPTTVGNVIQSDSLDLDLTVEAVQCRHNDTPFDDTD